MLSEANQLHLLRPQNKRVWAAYLFYRVQCSTCIENVTKDLIQSIIVLGIPYVFARVTRTINNIIYDLSKIIMLSRRHKIRWDRVKYDKSLN